ncbi:MAG: hypothetical protein K0R57_2828 [Paenibacillaceae bacterium]|jgi:hypothetical protein|nr:hypothetical protein [Paenibacillaceae bacterium]
MKRLWSNRSGNGLPLTVAMVLAVLMVSCAIYEYMRLTIIASGVRDAVQSAIVEVATENYDEVYPGLREGYSGGYRYSGGWQQRVSTGDVWRRLDGILGLTPQGGQHEKAAGGQMEYALSGLSIQIRNAPLAPASIGEANKFQAETEIHLEVPLSFGWSALPSMKATLQVKAGYTPKF